jgi:hypothetical protein
MAADVEHLTKVAKGKPRRAAHQDRAYERKDGARPSSAHGMSKACASVSESRGERGLN